MWMFEACYTENGIVGNYTQTIEVEPYDTEVFDIYRKALNHALDVIEKSNYKKLLDSLTYISS